MRSFAIATVLVAVLGGAPVFAQAAGQQAAPAAQQVPLPPSAPFPQGAKVALVNLQQIAALSADGKAATVKVQALVAKKQNEATQRSKSLQDNQNKLQQSGALMNEAARAALTKEVERQQVEGQRFEQDAQAEINELQNDLQAEFQRKLFPVLTAMATEKGLQLLLSAADAGAIWADPGIDLTGEAIKRLDAAAPLPPVAKTPAAAAPRPPAAAAPKPAPAKP